MLVTSAVPLAWAAGPGSEEQHSIVGLGCSVFWVQVPGWQTAQRYDPASPLQRQPMDLGNSLFPELKELLGGSPLLHLD